MKIFSTIAILVLISSCSEVKDEIAKPSVVTAEEKQEPASNLQTQPSALQMPEEKTDEGSQNHSQDKQNSQQDVKQAAELQKADVNTDAGSAQQQSEQTPSDQSNSEPDKSAPDLNNSAPSASNEAKPNIVALDNSYDIDGINTFDIVLGDPESRVKLIAYSSLTCSACAYNHENVFNQIKQKYIDTNKIAYVIRLFVASSQDFEAAVLSMCDKSQFYKFLDTLYSSQQSWAFSKNYSQILTSLGQIGGISPDQYRQCLNDINIRDGLIVQSRKLAEKFKPKVVATPAFILNGVFLPAPYSFEAISGQIEGALAQ